MDKKKRLSATYIIGLLWILYTLYLTIIKRIYLFFDNYIEILVVACIQIFIYLFMKMIFKRKYIEAIRLSSITSCVLVILWQYSFLKLIISTGTILKLFLVSNIVIVSILYVRNKMFYKEAKISYLKQLGIVFITNLANVIGAIFTFYIVHYLIL